MFFSITIVARSLDVARFPSQAPSEYEANPEMLFYRITHLSRGKQYHIWAAAVTTAGRGNMSSKVIVEPAGKGGSCRPACGGGAAVGTSLKVRWAERAKEHYEMAT